MSYLLKTDSINKYKRSQNERDRNVQHKTKVTKSRDPKGRETFGDISPSRIRSVRKLQNPLALVQHDIKTKCQRQKLSGAYFLS